MTATARREVSSLGYRAAAAGRAGDARACRALLLEALSWLPAPGDGEATGERHDAVVEAVARALSDGCPWSDYELAAVARCSEDEARAARALVEAGRA